MNNATNIKHLYWRASFGLRPEEWPERRAWTIQRAVDQLFPAGPAPLLSDPGVDADYAPGMMSQKQRGEDKKLQRKRVAEIGREWIGRMAGLNDANPFLEKMCLFWHGHFACTIRHGVMATRYLNTLRSHALGNFRDFLRAIARDPAMIRFLNNQQNRKNAPNENFARELMELFTIGRGNYTENDVKEAARAFTGWSSSLQGEFVFRRGQHDYDEKNFFGKTGYFDGDDIIEMILEREETAVFIAGKVFRFFVSSEDDNLKIKELAGVFRDSDYDISSMMYHLFTSDWFYDPAYVASRIKSPVELLAGLAGQLHITDLPTVGVVAIQRILGQQLFNPPNVAGWPGDRTWIDNSTLLTRLNLASGLLLASDFDLQLPDDLEDARRQRLKRFQATLDLQPLRELADSPSGNQRQELGQYLLSPATPTLSLGGSETDLLILRLLSTPEYQLC